MKFENGLGEVKVSSNSTGISLHIDYTEPPFNKNFTLHIPDDYIVSVAEYMKALAARKNKV